MELDWATDHDIEPFLSQPQFMEDYLGPYLDLIRTAGHREEKHAIIWSISNLVPLKQFHSNEWKVVYYEDLCTQPEIELPGIFEAIGYKFSGSFVAKINQPSQTTRRTSPVVAGTDKIGYWQQKLSCSQIDNILRIVQAFGLGHLYGDSTLPLNKNI
jgi:hypothetical protein